VAFVKNTFPRDLTLDGLSVVVDAAHGAAYVVAPLVFTELGARVHALGCARTARTSTASAARCTRSTRGPRW